MASESDPADPLALVAEDQSWCESEAAESRRHALRRLDEPDAHFAYARGRAVSWLSVVVLSLAAWTLLYLLLHVLWAILR